MTLIVQNLLFIGVKVLQALAISFLLIILLKKEIKADKRTLLFVGITTAIVFLSAIANDFSTNLRAIASLATIFLMFLECKYIYKVTNLSAFTSVLFSFLIGGLAEVTVIFVATNFYNFNFENIINLSYTKIACTFFADILVFGAGYLINTLIIKKLAPNYIAKNNNSFFYTLLLITILFLPQILYLIDNNYAGNKIFLFSSFIQLIVIIVISLQKVKILSMRQKIIQDLENEKMYNETLTRMVEAVRGFKHDANNIINTMNGYIVLNDMEGLKKYFNKGLLQKTYDLKSIEQLSPKLLNDSGIYNLIASKYFECTNNNIHLLLDITSDIASLQIPKFEFSRILGILLDNAIEATKGLKTEDKKIKFSLYKNFVTNVATIVIENNFVNDHDITVEKVFLKNFSTKEKPSGFGLYEVKKTIEGFKNVNLETKINDDKFIQKITIINN